MVVLDGHDVNDIEFLVDLIILGVILYFNIRMVLKFIDDNYWLLLEVIDEDIW